MINDDWVQVPDFPNYEVNQKGQVRNAKTGHVLKPYTSEKGDNAVCLCGGNGVKCFTANNLLWLTHGKIKGRSTIAVPVIITKGNERHYFNSSREAARFIARREHFSDKAVRYYFRHRRKEAHGWRINYQR